MFDVRTPHPQNALPFLAFLLLLLSTLVVARDSGKDQSKDQVSQSKTTNDEGKSKATGDKGSFIKLDGKLRCDKSDPEHTIEVPDRPGHALILTKRKCTWTEPMTLIGAQSKDAISIDFIEKMEGTLHVQGFAVSTLDNGEKLTWKTMGQVVSDKAPATTKGRWSLMRGTGKFKGIKGGGTYEGKLEAGDVLTLEFEGVYDPSEMVGEKK
jgi:hypothetical protein